MPAWGRHLLYLPSLGVAFLGVLVFVAALVLDPVRQFAVRPVTALAAAFAGLLFLRGLFDPKVHRGTAAANRELSLREPFALAAGPCLIPNGAFSAHARVGRRWTLALTMSRRSPGRRIRQRPPDHSGGRFNVSLVAPIRRRR